LGLQNFARNPEATKVKTLRRITAATILSLTLAIYVLAGQIEVNGATAPPPTGSTTTTIVLMVVSLIYP
jgi:hypothetical protein